MYVCGPEEGIRSLEGRVTEPNSGPVKEQQSLVVRDV